MQTRHLSRSLADFAVREDQGERVIEGIAVPWDTEIDVWGERERFERGAFGEFRGGAPLYAEHSHLAGGLPIGLVTDSEARDEGQWVRARISATQAGDDVYALLRDGALKSFSIGFTPTKVRKDDDVAVYTAAQFREVSVVGFPAYETAAITAVRHREPAPATREDPMTAPTIELSTAPEMVELRSAVEDLSRRVTVIAEDGLPAAPAAPPAIAGKYRSLAHFIKALASPEARPAGFDARADAQQLSEAYAAAAERLDTRAYTGATTTSAGAPVSTSWIDRDIRLVQENRNVLNLFDTQPLPADGMSVSYPVFSSKSGDVAKQANEGDNLAYLALVVGSGTAPVSTYGGYSEMSRQLIERSGLPFLAKVLEMQKISYAKVTNGVIRTALAAGTTTYNQVTLAASPTAVNLIDLVIDGLAAVHTNSIGLEAEFWVMTLAQYKSIAHITDSTGRPIFVLNGDGQNSIGDAKVGSAPTVLRGNVGGFPFFVDLGMSGSYSYIASSHALTTLESPGAPYQLTDENIINLTKQFSLYGYLASTLNDAKGITRVTHS